MSALEIIFSDGSKEIRIHFYFFITRIIEIENSWYFATGRDLPDYKLLVSIIL